jgi:hypothetical protein
MPRTFILGKVPEANGSADGPDDAEFLLEVERRGIDWRVAIRKSLRQGNSFEA